MKIDINFFKNITASAVFGVGKYITRYAVIKTLKRVRLHKTLKSVYTMHCLS